MNTKPHYSEADLLETYYTQPGESMPVMMHLADCDDCAARYERVERKIRGLAACAHEEKPETFWARQRIAIMRRVANEQPQRTTSFARIGRIAAAAMLVLVLGGVIAWDRTEDAPALTATATTSSVSITSLNEPAAAGTAALDSTDPWQSDELKDFGSMVDWESWVEQGDQSL